MTAGDVEEGRVNEQKDQRQAIDSYVGRMMELLGWDLAVSVEEQPDGSLIVNLSGDDRDLVLCNRAEVLETLQYLLNRSFVREKGDGQRILLDCDGYRARKEAELREIALRVSNRVRRTGEREELGLMNPYERRIVHLAVAETEGVRTESTGDGVMKRVVILPA
jgi:spoIIIJ-associated protein